MSEISVRQGDRIRVSAEVGARASIATIQGVLGWLGTIEKIAVDVERLRGTITVDEALREPVNNQAIVRSADRLWIERLRFENPLEVVLGGALSLLVYRIIIVIRDWKTEQRRRHAEASNQEAAAWAAYQVAERQRLQNALVAQVIEHMDEVGLRGRQIELMEHLLGQKIPEQIDRLADAPAELDAEVVDR